MTLAEVQRAVRDALVVGEASGCAPLLVGGANPLTRLAVHQRHYESSLVRALMTKFPACAWLVGGAAMAEAVRHYVHAHPPTRPCIAEYGHDFPELLARSGPAVARPYVGGFGKLEWHIGQVSIAVDAPPIDPDRLRRLGDDLADVRPGVQPGVRYLRAPWPVDELMRLFLTDAAPGRYALDPEDVRVEVRGARGAFRVRRLDPGTFGFRSAVAEGLSLGDAVDRGLAADADLDPGVALAGLLSDGLVTGFTPRMEEHS